MRDELEIDNNKVKDDEIIESIESEQLRVSKVDTS